MKRILISLAVSFLTIGACSSPGPDETGTANTDMAVVGGKVRLGMNPAPPPGGTIDGWPVAGSAESLYMARIWDMDVTWAHIEPSPPVNGVHSYSWDTLDKLVNDIIAADMRPMYVLYGTPPWAAPGCKPNYTGACTVYPEDPENWSAFTRAVAARYVNQRTSKGEATVFEVWNEPNLGEGAPIPYWEGTHDQLLDLNRRAWESVKQVAPGPLGTVLCCGWNRLAANNSTGAVDAWLKRGGGDYVDAVSYHPYPKDWDPATAADITHLFRSAMNRHSVARPLWATEVGFINGLYGDGRALTHKEQAVLVSHTILTLRAEAVPVILWYPWDESHVGFADSNFVGLHRVVAEALEAAHGDPTAPPASTCDPVTQPAPQWGLKNGKCLGACGLLGGTSASTAPCVKQGLVDAGDAYDVDYCCQEATVGACDSVTQPAPQWGEKNGQCLAGCGVIGGTSAFTAPCDQNGKVDAGQAYDVDYCCWDASEPATVCDPTSQPSPQWGQKNGQCLQACGIMGGTSAFTTPCDQNGKVDVGQAYDVDYCCKEATVGPCDPATQPAPQWGMKNGQCLQACGSIGGTSAFETPCAQNGVTDAGPAYDVAYCCKEAASACDPATQPSPQWGVKNGQCLPACGIIGGTSAFETPCAQNGKVDVGPAYDVAYCCKEPATVCDPATQPAPQWGVKNGMCLPACGVMGGTSAFDTPCAQNGKVDAGQAYDVTYCCKEICDPVTQPAPQWGVKNGQCLQACGLIGGTAAFETPCGQNGMTDAGPAYDVAYCCK